MKKYNKKIWGSLTEPEKTELLKAADVIDGRTGNKPEKSGPCIVDFSNGLSVPGFWDADSLEITIDNAAVIYNPAE